MQFCEISCGSESGSTGLTHTVTHTPKCPERDRKRQTGSFSLLPGVLFSAVVLHDLRHKIPHGFCSLILHLPGGVGVGSERESGIIVAQHTGDRFHVHSVLKRQGCEGVSEVVEANMLQPSILQNLLVELYHGIWMIHFACDRRGEHIRVIRVLVVFLNQQVQRTLWDRNLPY